MMSSIKKIVFLLAAVLILTCQISCSGVTETGNPCQTVGCDESVQAGQPGDKPGDEPVGTPSSAYTNSSFGVRISYPSGWSYVEGANGDSVIFSDAGQNKSSSEMIFERLSPKPSQLLSYLEGLYPNRSFVAYSTANIFGYSYDDPAVGATGGDAREYFFLKGDVLIHIEAEIFTAAEDQFEKLLEGISFI